MVIFNYPKNPVCNEKTQSSIYVALTKAILKDAFTSLMEVED